MLESLTDLPVKNWEELWRFCVKICGDDLSWAQNVLFMGHAFPSSFPASSVRSADQQWSSDVNEALWKSLSESPQLCGNAFLAHGRCPTANESKLYICFVFLMPFHFCHFSFFTMILLRSVWPGASDTVWHWWQKYVVPGPRIPGSDSVLQDRSQGLHSPHGMSRLIVKYQQFRIKNERNHRNNI